MEDILSVYHRPYDPKRPLVCLDEFCKQLLREVRTPRPTAPGKAAQYDSEYIREGCATAFMIYAPLEGHREIFITQSATRTSVDYALALEFLAEHIYPDADKIILVEDNLNTHDDASLYKAFAPEKARRLVERFERHHTPCHGSWLNIAESEIAAIHCTHLDDRIPNASLFRRQCKLASSIRNQKSCTTNWRFNVENARLKLSSLYPSIQS